MQRKRGVPLSWSSGALPVWQGTRHHTQIHVCNSLENNLSSKFKKCTVHISVLMITLNETDTIVIIIINNKENSRKLHLKQCNGHWWSCELLNDSKWNPAICVSRLLSTRTSWREKDTIVFIFKKLTVSLWPNSKISLVVVLVSCVTWQEPCDRLHMLNMFMQSERQSGRHTEASALESPVCSLSGCSAR